MAEHMRRNDKLQALAASVPKVETSSRSEAADDAAAGRGAAGAERAGRRAASDSRDGSDAASRGDRRAHASKTRAGRRSNAAVHSSGGGKGLSTGEFLKRNATYIISVVAVVVLVVLMIFFLRACAPAEQVVEKGAEASSYESPYDWANLDRTEGRYAYIVDGQVKSRLGIDVSESQQDIDWQAVAGDGIDFAMIRLGYRGATEGDLYLDASYWSNIDGARSAGIDCGIYFFSQAITEEEAVEEAEFVLDCLGGTALEYPIAFDSEVVTGAQTGRTAGLSRDEMSAIADAFCKRVEQGGYDTLVYGNAGDLSRYSGSVVGDGGIWWAEYDASQPSHYLDIAMWQYSNAGAIAGISTNVDMNIDLSGVLS